MNEVMYKYELSKFINDNSYGVAGNMLSESVQANVSDAILAKMFELTIGKYNKIDFSDIERSRGDVTKTKFYNNLNECINTLIDIHTVTNKIPDIIIVSEALNSLKSMKNTFEYNFRIKNNCAIMIYNVIYYAIMEATSYIIATSIDFAKESTDKNSVELAIYESSGKPSTLVSSLNSFNKCVADNSIMKFMKDSAELITTNIQNESAAGVALDFAIDTVKKFIFNDNGKIKDSIKKGAVITIAVLSSLYIASNIIPIIREIVYWIYRARNKISDAAALQAEMLELNIDSLRQQNKSGRHGISNDTIIARQTKYVKAFKTIANKFAIECDKNDRDTNIDIKQDKIDVSDIVI